MKSVKLMLGALCATAFLASVSVSCSDINMYKIVAPDDLQSRIDAAAEMNNPVHGDTTLVTISNVIVGAEDNSSGWWTSFSDYFTIPSNQLLHLEFVNHGTGVNNWNNWNLGVTTAHERDTDGYSEYFVIRSDAYGWGNSDYNGAKIGMDYPDTDGDGDVWNDFREYLQGAYVEMDIDHSQTGNVFVTVKHTAKDGTILTETYDQPVSATDPINAFLICDGSWFEMKKAYLIPSKVKAIDDQPAVSIVASNTPAILELGTEDYIGEASFVVTFADNSTKVVPIDDVYFTVPDLTTLGKKTILYSYSKTMLGNYGTAVAGYYTLEVINPVVKLDVVEAPAVDTYYVYDMPVALDVNGLVVNATYSDGSEGIIPVENLVIDMVQPAETGKQNVKISYVGVSATVETAVEINVVKGYASVGLPDYTNGWWTTFSEDYAVAAGSSKTLKVFLYSDNLSNWHSPCVILRRADLSEYCVVRMDNFGWGASYDGNENLVMESNWNWDVFASSMNLSTVIITVTNNGDGTAEIYYDVTYANGEKHFQRYANIPVDSADLQTALVTEESYLVLFD